ncbi:MAG TPA: acyl-CoA dehydrogenase family protein [Candidatus Sulfotelmatobacter sp.]|nr:acyl-CoA dehydrogenase family protein [Candidatus Sulfotelmatobacter sp.]
MRYEETLASLRAIAADFAAGRAERQRRRHLDPADFRRLAEAGFLLTGLPVAEGGYWQDVVHSARPICALLRVLAEGDPSVALVASMHPTVLAIWLHLAEAEPEFQAAWAAQRRAIFDTVKAGHWWGTVTSEPGSGGDIMKTRTAAVPGADGRFRLTGQKHFASGSGNAAYMITTALPAGADLPDIFILDLRGMPWDGSRGIRLVTEWDGHGMSATQSHAFAFEGFAAERNAWPASVRHVGPLVATFGAAAFTAVVVGIIDSAMAAARTYLTPKRAAMRAYDQVEWTRIETEAWLIQQAFAGMLAAIEGGDGGRAYAAGLHGKLAVAELAESLMQRLCKVIGGASFARGSPFGVWAADVRALGFLRPPWGLAYEQLFANTLLPPG